MIIKHITKNAIDHLEPLSPKTIFPHRLTRMHQLALAVWGLAILLFFLPSIPWLHSPAQRLERVQVQRAGEQITKLADSLQKRPEMKKYAPLLKQMKKLGGEMSHNRIDKRESMKRLNQIKEEFEKQAKAEGEANAMANAGQDAGNKSGDGARTEQSAAGKDLDAAQEGLEDARMAMSAENGQLASNTTGTAGMPGNGENGASGGENAEGNPTDVNSGKKVRSTETGVANGKGTGAQNGDKSGESGGSDGEGKGDKGSEGQSGNSGSGSEGKDGNGGKDGHGGGNHGGHSDEHGPGGGPGIGGTGGEEGGAGYKGDKSHERPHAGYVREKAKPLIGKGASLMIPGRIRGGSGGKGSSAVPYYQVYTDYRKRAEHALDREQVPPEDRQRVKQYFDALDPANGK